MVTVRAHVCIGCIARRPLWEREASVQVGSPARPVAPITVPLLSKRRGDEFGYQPDGVPFVAVGPAPIGTVQRTSDPLPARDETSNAPA
jgi:hypothetical protein